jgi:hypothetical protein
MSEPGSSGADASSAPIDLSGVDPTRWAETRRRVAILREWCAKPRHSKAEAIAAAARMGVSIGQFNRLVATWKAHEDVVRISGANRRRGAAQAHSSLPQATRAAINGAITTLGPDASFTSILAEATRLCRTAATPTASYGMVHYLIMRARRDRGSPSEGRSGRLLVGHVEALLPISDDKGGSLTPTLLLAVEEDSRRIVAHRLLTHPAPWTSDLASLLAEIAQDPRSDSRVIVAVAGDLDLPDGADVVRAGGPRLLAPVLGSHLDTLPLRHQRTRQGETRRVPGDPVSKLDAHLAVNAAIRAHNDRLSA